MHEYHSTVTALGIRFWDPVSDGQVRDNLVVTAYPVLGTGPVKTAFRTASGVYGFQGLPGMQAVELKESDEDDVALPVSPSFTRSFFIEVSDKLNRYLPTVFQADLPLSYDGIYLSDDTSLPAGSSGSSNPPGFYLFSAPSRSVTPGLAAIHTTLIRRTTGEPAAYAVMEVDVQGTGGEDMGKWYGIADERGCISILFPYPDMDVSLSPSPPASPSVPLDQQEWQLTVQVRYAPENLTYPTNINMESGIPLLESILTQSAGGIWTEGPVAPALGLFVNQWSTVLTFGEALILTTEGVDKSELWIDEV